MIRSFAGHRGRGTAEGTAQASIRLFPGVQGLADQAVKALLAGTLEHDPDTVCTHHHGEEASEARPFLCSMAEDGCRHGSCGA